jgi:YidC/Oxa1 family membrane protein insertase
MPLPGFLSAYAIALILVAVVVKTVTFPLTAVQLRSMRAMQELQPQLKKLQNEHKDDRELLAKKQMELYQEHGVSPFGGCLPMIIQLPILWGLFRAINLMGADPRFSGSRFFWIGDLSKPEALPTSPSPGLPLLLILMVASQFAYQKFMTPPTPSDGDAQADAMRSVMKFSPLFFAFIFVKFPAGLVLYYTTFNVVSVAQQWLLNQESGIQGLSLPVLGGEKEERTDGAADAAAEEETKNERVTKRRRRKKVR